MEARKSFESRPSFDSSKGLEPPPKIVKKRGSFGVTSPEPGVSNGNNKSIEVLKENKSFTSKLETNKLDNLHQVIRAQEEQDPKLAAKLGRLSDNIDSVIDKTRSAREELVRMTEITKELKAQTEIQEIECKNLEADQMKIRQDIEYVTKRMELLLAEKQRIEERLETMKDQNNKLEEFLETNQI